MKPPSRLLDDPNFARELRDDLARVVRHPHQVDLDRAARALAVAIGAGVVASSAPAAASSAAGSSVSLALKGTLAALGSATLVGVAVVTLQPAHEPPRREVTAPQPTAAAPARVEVPAPPPTAASDALPEATHVQPQPAAAPSASRREIAQLRRIQRLLPEQPAAAYRLAQASQREFPNGALREEREGPAVLALFQLPDRERAEREAERYLRRHPNSTLAERIRTLRAEQ
ncbi:MAG TPA: hypothetical protein VJR89_34320 [Polyangiales bacterium]|nr:hypothetical protein [Polyangiales bacterium]